MKRFTVGVGSALMLLQLTTSLHADDEPPALVQRVVDSVQHRGGLAVQIGRHPAELPKRLAQSDRWLVQVLHHDAQEVESLRSRWQEQGVYGGLSVRQWSGIALPYADNLVNLILVGPESGITRREVLRVLAPLGMVWWQKEGIWQSYTKPWPQDLDHWTHYLHDASNNAVSHDQRVGPPQHIQWQAPPLWSRNHGYTPSLSAMVSNGGRLFYIIDEGTGIPDSRFDRWQLCARDAFSGVLLWKRPLTGWGRATWRGTQRGGGGNWNSPTTLPRRLVSVDDRVYVTLGYRAPVSVLEAATGRRIATWEQTQYAEEVLWSEGTLIVRQRASIPDSSGHHAWNAEAERGGDGKPVIPAGTEGRQAVCALDAATGNLLWRRPVERMVTLSLAAAGGRVCYHTLDQVACLDLKSGRPLWHAPSPAWPTRMGTAGTLVMDDQGVFFSGDHGLQVWDAATGKERWRGPRIQRSAPWQPPDLLLVQGLLWGGLTPEMADCPFPRLKAPDVAPALGGTDPAGRSLADGSIARRVSMGPPISPGHHVRCYRSKATDRYLLYNKRGIEFVDLSGGGNHARCDWTRGECNYGVVPANGLLYVPPHPCACYRGVLRNGFFAYAADHGGADRPLDQPRLFKGPAYEQPADESTLQIGPEDWPTYRHDEQRSGWARTNVARELAAAWRTKLQGRLTPPVIGGGCLLVGLKDRHAIACLDAADGRLLWKQTIDAPVDTPPTLLDGLAIVGGRDGRVYAFRMTDGALAWSFLAAPTERWVVDRGHLESAWPLHGSVLPWNGLIYVAAGRSSYLDGGIRLYALDPRTGRVVHQTVDRQRQQEVVASPGHAYWADGSEAFLLVTDSKRQTLFMAQSALDAHLRPVKLAAPDETGRRRAPLHLAPMSDFTDDTWFHRTAWRYCRSWPGVTFAADGPKSGQLLAFDDKTTYALRAYWRQSGHNPLFVSEKEGYVLAADENDNEAVKPRGYRIGRARAAKWTVKVPIRGMCMVLTDRTVFLAGPPNAFPEEDPYVHLEGRGGAELLAVSSEDGSPVARYPLESTPIFDGMAAARGHLFLVTTAGEIVCYGPQTEH